MSDTITLHLATRPEHAVSATGALVSLDTGVEVHWLFTPHRDGASLQLDGQATSTDVLVVLDHLGYEGDSDVDVF